MRIRGDEAMQLSRPEGNSLELSFKKILTVLPLTKLILTCKIIILMIVLHYLPIITILFIAYER